MTHFINNHSHVHSKLGVIIEFNGPNHYENYMKSLLGPSVMKKRHLEGLGYIVMEVSYQQYKIFDTKEYKIKTIESIMSYINHYLLTSSVV